MLLQIDRPDSQVSFHHLIIQRQKTPTNIKIYTISLLFYTHVIPPPQQITVLIAIMNINKNMIKALNTLGPKELHFDNKLRADACLINQSFNHICVLYSVGK